VTVQRDPDAILAAWLEDGPNRLPDATRRAIAVTTRTTHQTRRPRWVPWRFPPVNGASRLILGGVAVLAVALGGLYLFNGLPESGVGTPSSVPTPSPSPAPISYDSHAPGELEPGTYVIEHIDPNAPVRVTVTVPAAGWEKLRAPGVIFGPGSGVTLAFASARNLFADPCAADRAKRNPPVGPTVDDLVTALDTTPNLDATATDVTMSGFHGRQVALTALAPWEPCAAGEPTLFDLGGPEQDWGPPDTTDTNRLWLLDVDGSRLVIAGNSRVGATPADLANLQSMIDSIRIDTNGLRPSPSPPNP
jgi:hypothetical protein